MVFWHLIDGLLLAYGRAGEGFLLPFWPVLLAFTPLTVLIHELGHGVVGAAVTKRPVKIHIGLGSAWCKLMGEGRITVRAYAAFVGAGPLASFVQVAVALWLAALAEPGSITQWVIFACALNGVLCGVLSLVPMELDGATTDGQKLLDLGRWIFAGRRPGWLPGDDPHVARSDAPPG